MDWVGIDIGTSRVKGARFDADGRCIRSSALPCPAPVRGAEGVFQDLEALVSAATRIRDQLSDGAAGIAVTAQRNTAVWRGRLVSWLDPRDPSAWHRPDGRCLVSELTERWTGRAGITPEAASIRCPQGPERVSLGESAGQWRGIHVYPTAGDKNCALLGNGVSGSVAGLSLGSAVSLGLRAHGTPSPEPGVFLSRAAERGCWDVETGLVAGMSARAGLSGWLPMDRVPSTFVDDLWMLPHFAGALDRPATGALIGLRVDTSALQIAAAWTQGVVAELVRLRPVLERVAGGTIEKIRISGGGTEGAWDPLVADAFDCPVERPHGRFAGCRGAVDAVARGQGWQLADPSPPGTETQPANPERFARWAARYDSLFAALE